LIETCECEDGCPACIGPSVGEDGVAGPDVPEPRCGSRKALILDIVEAFGVGTVH